MRIDITTLRQGVNRLDLTEDAESLEIKWDDSALVAPVRISLDLDGG